jgi:two-component system chemotaxis response regulator CheY
VSEKPPSVKAAHAQAAIVRTLTGEMLREERGSEAALALRAQALEESARLVATLEGLGRARTPDPGSAPAVRVDKVPGILVVEDDEQARAALARGLSPEYDVTVAANGVEGLRAASVRRFDAIIADIAMPEMDGIAMVEAIRRSRPDDAVPVLFLTAETSPERVTDGFAAGATAYLVKPVDLDVLDQELRWLLGVSQG